VSEHGLDVDEGRKPENSNKNRSRTGVWPCYHHLHLQQQVYVVKYIQIMLMVLS